MKNEKGVVRGKVVKLSMEEAEGKILEAKWQAYETTQTTVSFGQVQGVHNMLYTSASEPRFGFYRWWRGTITSRNRKNLKSQLKTQSLRIKNKNPTNGEYVYDREEHLAQQEAESNSSMYEEYKKRKAARKAAEEKGLTTPHQAPPAESTPVKKKCRYE
jgi:hypothetical protein